jgi:hypothetical protein
MIPLLFFVLWCYGMACLASLAWLAARWAWRLLSRPGREELERQARIEHDREAVRLGHVPGYRG